MKRLITGLIADKGIDIQSIIKLFVNALLITYVYDLQDFVYS